MPFTVVKRNRPGFRIIRRKDIEREPEKETPGIFTALRRGFTEEVTSPLSLIGRQPDVELVEERPIATVIGRGLGILPTFLATGPLTAPLLGLKAVRAAMAAKGLAGIAARAGIRGIRLGSQFAATEVIQGRPKEAGRAFTAGAVLGPAGAIPGRLERSLATAFGLGGVSAIQAPPGEKRRAFVTGTAVGGVAGLLPRFDVAKGAAVPTRTVEPVSAFNPTGKPLALLPREIPPIAKPTSVTVPIKKPTLTLEKTTFKDPVFLSAEELDRAVALSRRGEREGAIRVFGPEQAKKYERLQRTANTSIDVKKADIASDQLSKMESGLSKEQERILFGIGEKGPSFEDLKDFTRALDQVDVSSADSIGRTIARSISKIPKNVRELGAEEIALDVKLALAQVRFGVESAKKSGFSLNEIGRSAGREIKRMFPDPDDAAFMLSKAKELDFLSIESQLNKLSKATFEIETIAAQPIAKLTPGTELLKKPALTLENERAVVTAAVREAAQNPQSQIVQDNTQRLFKRITAELVDGGLDIPGLLEVQKRSGLSAQQFSREFAAAFQEAKSFHGKGLNQLSQAAKAIRKALPPEEAAKLFDPLTGPPTAFEATKGFIVRLPQNAINVWRASLVSQLATMNRNAISQAGRYTVGVAENATIGALEVITGKATAKAAFAPAMEDVFALGRAVFRTKGLGVRSKLLEVLEQQPIEASQFYGTIMGDVSMGGRYARLVTSGNRLQEFFFRRMIFDATVRSELLRKGLDPAKVTGISEEILSKAIERSLTLTFASSKNIFPLAKVISDINQKMPFLYTLGGGFTFPRFWGNAVKFLWDHSPGGFARLLNPKVAAKMVRGDREGLAVIAQASLGTLMFGGAVAFRNSKWAGPRWYEIQLQDGRTIDTRPFNPFASYMFMAELMNQHAGTAKGLPIEFRDWAEFGFGMRRLSGTGFVTLDIVRDMFRGEVTQGTMRRVNSFIGEFVGGFATPYATIGDFISQGSPEDAIVRSSREHPLFGPTLQRLPTFGRELPPFLSPLRAGPLKREQPALRQLTGLTIRPKRSPAEFEAERLQLRVFDLGPKTGDPTIDRMIIARMGFHAQGTMDRIVQSPAYQNLPEFRKEKEFRAAVTKLVRTPARKEFLASQEDFFVQRVQEQLDDKTPKQRLKLLNRLKNSGLLPQKILRQLR